MTTRRRAVITGLGAVTPLGLDLPATWEALLAGASGVRPIARVDVSRHAAKIAAMVKGFDPLAHFSPPDARHLDMFCQYALVACREAVADSGIDFGAEDSRRCGVIMATGIGGILEIEAQHSRLLERGPDRVTPHFIPKIMANAVSGQMAIRHGLKGPNFVTASACASAGHAIGLALRTIQWGEADVVLTGGSEAATTPLGLAGFSNMKALSTRNDDPEAASRPYDRDRDGFVMGEGAAVLVLEERERALRRGARIYAELAGFGMNDDAFHVTAPDETASGACEVMRLALADAGLGLDSIDYVNGHGTSTPLNDRIEVLAMARLFADRVRRIAVSSTKSMLGHLLGASAAVETAVTALSLYHQRVHPTRNFAVPDDPALGIDFVAGEARELPLRHAIKNSFGFGGHNASLILARAV